MERFLYIILITSLALIAGIVSVGLLFIVTWLNNYSTEGIGRLLWVTASFLGGVTVALILVYTLPTKIMGINKLFLVLPFIIIVSSLVQQFAIISDFGGGYYYLPPGFSAAKMTNEELEKLLSHRNYEIGSRAFLELKKRGAKASVSMMRIIQRNTIDNPDGFIDMPIVQDAVETLAKQKDERMIPILQKMLKSKEHYDSYYRGTYTKTYYPTRIFAKKLLKKYFGIESNVETEKRVSPKRGK